MRTLAELKTECGQQNILVQTNGKASKQPYIDALRNHYWQQENPDQPLPAQIKPMLLSEWSDRNDTDELEADLHAWIVQEKKDGVRALLHVESDKTRITSRCTSSVNYRLSEHQENLPHLTEGLEFIKGTVFDGELECPITNLDTSKTVTTTGLQATTAILSTSVENATRIQANESAKVRLHVFDILQYQGDDVTFLPLWTRLDLLAQAFKQVNNAYIELVPSYVVNKAAIHHRIIANGLEGTVWKKVSAPYESGRRVKHWIKRKTKMAATGFVTNFKLGTPGRGNAEMIGAVEFSVQEHGYVRPIAWVSNWSDVEREAMTHRNEGGSITLNPSYFGRKAEIIGQDESGRSKRLRHARCNRWLVEP